MIDEELGALVEDKDIPYSVQLQLIKKRTERGMSPLQISRLMGLKKKGHPSHRDGARLDGETEGREAR